MKNGDVHLLLHSHTNDLNINTVTCTGFVADYLLSNKKCFRPPYGTSLLLDPEGERATPLLLSRVKGSQSGHYQISASNRGPRCRKYIGVDRNKCEPTIRFYSSKELTDAIGSEWKIEAFSTRSNSDTQDAAQTPAPLPAPNSMPAQGGPSSSSGYIPGPTIYSKEAASDASIVVLIKDIGGNTQCEVQRILIKWYFASPGGESFVDMKAVDPKVKQHSLDVRLQGRYRIQAQGLCRSLDDRTSLSNEIFVSYYLNYAPQATPKSPPGAPGVPTASNIQASSAVIAWSDSALASPAQTYTVKCLVGTGTSCSSIGGVVVAGVAQCTGSTSVSLVSGTTYALTRWSLSAASGGMASTSKFPPAAG